MLRTFNAALQALQQECALEARSRLMIDSYLTSPRFTDAVIAAAEETTRTANADKILRFGLVLANGCDPEIDVSDDADLSSFIRDVSQLSELDLRTLQIVASTARADILLESDVPDSTDNMLGQHLIAAAAREKLERDDFYSHAYRLVGFGLLLEARPWAVVGMLEIYGSSQRVVGGSSSYSSRNASNRGTDRLSVLKSSHTSPS